MDRIRFVAGRLVLSNRPVRAPARQFRPARLQYDETAAFSWARNTWQSTSAVSSGRTYRSSVYYLARSAIRLGASSAHSHDKADVFPAKNAISDMCRTNETVVADAEDPLGEALMSDKAARHKSRNEPLR